jgi:hypothetical protein
MRQTERERELEPLDLGTVTDADQVERQRVALGRAVHHVRKQRASEALELATTLARAGLRQHDELAVFDRDLDALGQLA